MQLLPEHISAEQQFSCLPGIQYPSQGAQELPDPDPPWICFISSRDKRSLILPNFFIIKIFVILPTLFKVFQLPPNNCAIVFCL
jgi:hypothetical protein